MAKSSSQKLTFASKAIFDILAKIFVLVEEREI